MASMAALIRGSSRSTAAGTVLSASFMSRARSATDASSMAA
jgi:hypothetical protein